MPIAPPQPWRLAPLLAVALGATTPAAAQTPTALPGILVEAPREAATEGYLARRGTTATKTDTPVLETPQSVSTITRQQLEDRNVQTLSDALTYAPGVRIGAAGFDPRFDSFFVRGFDTVYNGIFRDQLRQAAGSFAVFRTEPYGLEAINVIRGPASVLYGLGSPGGLVDLVTKRPPFVPHNEVQLQLGSYERYQGQFDIGGPIGRDGRFAYRVTGLVRESETVLPGVRDDRAFIAPALTWRITPDTTLTVLGEYQRDLTGGSAIYYQAPDRTLTRLPNNDPAFNDYEQSQSRIGYTLDHRIDDTFSLRQNFRYGHIDSDLRYTSIDSLAPDGRSASRSTGRIVESLDTVAIDNQAQARFATGPVRHRVLAGLDYTHSGFGDRRGFGLAPDLGLAPPNYGRQQILAPALTAGNTFQTQDQLGVYLQDQARLGPLILTIGGRHDWLETETQDRLAGTTDRQSDRRFTGRVGLTYVTAIGVAPYASYSTGFNPTLGTDAGGRAFRPTTAEQVEVGVKYQPPGQASLVSAALFQIVQQNGLTTDPNDIRFQVQTGEVRSRGFELEGVASLGHGLSAIAAYTFLDIETTRANDGTAGRTPSGRPNHTVSLWGDYTVPEGNRAEGLGIGAGVRYLGPSTGDDTNTFRNADVTVFDAALRYELGALAPSLAGMRLAVNAYNVFDRDDVTCTSGFCYRAPRRTVIGSLRYRW